MERIFNQLLQIAKQYIDKRLYNFFVNKYNLFNTIETKKFFNDIFNSDNLLEYLFDIKEQIAVKFILQNKIDNANITDFAYNIYKFFEDNAILLYLIQKYININDFIIEKPVLIQTKFIKQANQSNNHFENNNIESNKIENNNITKIPNFDDYILGILCQYFIDSNFIEFILKKDYIKNMQDIYKVFENLDINLLKEYLQTIELQKISDELAKSINKLVNIDLYEYIYKSTYIISELIKRIQLNFSKIIYREFFEQGKYLNKLTQAKDLANIKDTKGQQTYIIRTDVNNRDKAFMDIDNEILLSEYNENHQQLFNKYLQKYNVRFHRGKRRPKKEEVLSKTKIKSWAYGHISNNVYIIDGVNNITIDQVTQDLKKKGVIGKIYSFEYVNNSVYYGLATREAKKVNKHKTINI